MVDELSRQEDDPRGLEEAVLAVVRDTCRDLHRTARPREVGLDSALERDLGLDSLARVELLVRLERALHVRLAENTLALLETPRDLLQAARLAPQTAARPRLAAARAPPEEPPAGEPEAAGTLQEVLDWHVLRHPTRTQIVIASAEGEEEIRYGELMLAASGIAARLQACGLAPGEAVAIMLPTCAAYFHTYFGVLLAGGVPVPIYPPAHVSRIEDHVRRHAGILANAQAACLVTVAEAMAAARILEALVPGLRHVLAVPQAAGERGPFSRVPAQPADLAFIQYTSGSTGNPKGVALTHANLLANIRAIGRGIDIVPSDVFVSWLPLYHDMGLIAAWLASLYYGNRLVVMSPLHFLARPEVWLHAIHRHRGTLTAAPNFAYELCVKRIADEDIVGVDLASLRLAANGAEPVSPDTMERFIARFAGHGFRREAMTPVYGLAEATVGLLTPPPGRGPRIDRINRGAFARDRVAVPAGAQDPHPVRFVACGRPLPGHEVRIVDERGQEVGERKVGTLEFRGPSATAGYFRNAAETQRLLHEGWLVTGDLAYRAEGEVYITGRVKDLIIRGGRNIYPQEIEEAVGAVAGIRKGCVAAFGSADAATGTQRLVVVAETRETQAEAQEQLRVTVMQTVAACLGEAADEVVLAPPHTIPKTSSGKLRRAASREAYERGLIGRKPHAVWWQFLRLAGSGVAAQSRALVRQCGRAAYALYARTVFWSIAPLVWLATAATARPATAWALSRRASRLFLRLIGVSLVVEGVDRLPRDEPFVLVANHASYLDGILLVAALPTPCRFVAKRELLAHFIPRIYLQRLGALFVERFAAQQSVEDAARLAAVARAGAALAIFPEGTFRRAPGLQAFRLGAFAVAAQAGIAVVPVAIRGSRSVLPDGQWTPHPGTVTLTIAEPVRPASAGTDAFANAVSLRDGARARILAHLDEADCGQIS